ncbi:hypothetical protein GW17_00025509, partial [Ensete ventricosum]
GSIFRSTCGVSFLIPHASREPRRRRSAALAETGSRASFTTATPLLDAHEISVSEDPISSRCTFHLFRSIPSAMWHPLMCLHWDRLRGFVSFAVMDRMPWIQSGVRKEHRS